MRKSQRKSDQAHSESEQISPESEDQRQYLSVLVNVCAKPASEIILVRLLD